MDDRTQDKTRSGAQCPRQQLSCIKIECNYLCTKREMFTFEDNWGKFSSSVAVGGTS